MQLTSITVSSVLAVALLPALMLADAKYDFPNNPIVYEGEVEAREERVTRIAGRLMAGDVVCAEATGEVAYRRT